MAASRVLPSFETLAEFIIGPRFARTRWQAPQDEVVVFFRLGKADVQCSVAKRPQHPLQMLMILRSICLSSSLTCALAAEGRDRVAATRVRFPFAARRTWSGR
jgi:hypothetical protein